MFDNTSQNKFKKIIDADVQKEILKSEEIQFGDRLLVLLKLFDATQAELSKATGISQPTISSYIIGRFYPSERNMRKISSFFSDYSYYFLTGEVDYPFPKSSNTYRYENLTEEQSNILFAFENAPTRVSSQFLDLLGYYFPRSIDIPRYPNLTEDQNINLYAYENAPESVRKRVYKLLADYFPKASQSSEPESLTKEQRLILNAYAHSTDTVRKRVINLLNLTNKIEL